jgi:hypothetical protein
MSLKRNFESSAKMRYVNGNYTFDASCFVDVDLLEPLDELTLDN